MRVDSLKELTSAFEEWRSNKKHAREPIPGQLLDRARRATKQHGVTAVVRATRVQRDRLFRAGPTHAEPPTPMGTTGPKAVADSVPAYSRLELSAPPAPGARLVAEVETGSGVTLRVFEPTPELMGLLSAMCGIGGVR